MRLLRGRRRTLRSAECGVLCGSQWLPGAFAGARQPMGRQCTVRGLSGAGPVLR
jgi:hypothetical protein